MDKNNEEDVPAYLDYFTAFYQDSETDRGSTEKSSDGSEHQDDDYDPTIDIEESQSSDTFSSDDCEWLPGKRTKAMARKRTKKRKKKPFGNESVSKSGSAQTSSYPGSAGSEGSRQRVGYVNNPDASGGEPSKTILRNILETPPAASISHLQSQKSKSVFFSPSLQALLMDNSKRNDIPSPKLSERKPESDGNVQGSPPVDNAGNVVTGSASSLLMAMLKKAHASSQSSHTSSTQDSECSGSSKMNKPVSSSEIKGFDHIIELARSSQTPFDNTIPPDVRLTTDIKQRIKRILPQDSPNPEQVSCDICKRKSSSTVCLRLPSVDKGVTDFKQWTVCEWCEVNVVGATGIDNPVGPQSVDSFNCGQTALNTDSGELKLSGSISTRSSLALPPNGEQSTSNKDGDRSKEWSPIVIKKPGQKTLLDSLFSSESWNRSHSGSTLTEILSDKNSKNVRPVGTCSTHRRKGNPKKIIKNVSDPLVTETISDESISLPSFGGVIVKLEPTDDFMEPIPSITSSESLVNNNKLENRETPHFFPSNNSVAVKQEPCDDFQTVASSSVEAACDVADHEVMQSSAACGSESDVLYKSVIHDSSHNASTGTCGSRDHFVNEECVCSDMHDLEPKLVISSVSSITGSDSISHNIKSKPDDKYDETDNLPLVLAQTGSKMSDSSKHHYSDSNEDKTFVSILPQDSVTCEQEQGSQPGIENSLRNSDMLTMLERQPLDSVEHFPSIVNPPTDVPAASAELKESTNTHYKVVEIKQEPIDVSYTGDVSSPSKCGKATGQKTFSKRCISNKSLKQWLQPERNTVIESTGDSKKSSLPLKVHKASPDDVLQSDSNITVHIDKAESPNTDFWTSNLLHKSQPKASSMPKSSSLLLQQLCMSHHSKAASRSSNILSQHHDNSQNMSSCEELKSGASNNASSAIHGETSSSLSEYNLSSLLRQICYRSTTKGSSSTDTNRDTSTSDNRDILEAQSSVGRPEKVSTPNTLLMQLFQKSAKDSASTTPSVQANSPEIKYSLTKQKGNSKSKSVDGIQPRNVFQIGPKVLSEDKQQEPKDNVHSRPLIPPQASEVSLRSSSRKSKHNKCNVDPRLSPLDVGDKVIEKKVLDNLKPFVCMRCSESFETSKSLRIHMRYHKQDKAYGCGICGRKYSTNGVLKKHILTYHSPVTKNCE